MALGSLEGQGNITQHSLGGLVAMASRSLEGEENVTQHSFRGLEAGMFLWGFIGKR